MHNVSRIRSILFALVVLAMSATAFAQIGISISFAPPELLRAASLSRPWLSLDAWLLGLRRRLRRLLLGAGYMGDGSGTRSALDSSLLGLE
jgi:hypothetical protein